MKLSLIIPVYNTEKYLSRCLSSIFEQAMDMSNIEVVIVDDGSTDNSSLIIKKFQEKFDNIKIVVQENKGLSEARNTGVSNSKGEYIWFIDSDDSITENSLEDIIKLINKIDFEILFFGFNYILSPDKSESYIVDNSNENGYYSLDDIIKSNINFRPMSWSYIYKRTFLIENNITFCKNLLHEDEEYSVKTLMLSNKNYFTNNIYYNYFLNSNSIMTTFKPKSIYDRIFILKTFKNMLKSASKNNDFILYRAFILLLTILEPNNIYKFSKKERKEIYSSIIKIGFDFSKLNIINKNEKLYLKLINTDLRFYVFLKHLYSKIS